MNKENIQCNKCNQDFALDENDKGFYQKMKVPNPKVCPQCRFNMRALFRNETTLYSGRKCDMCGKSIISMYNPKSPYTIYCYDCFYSEKWDPRDYAMDYDESRPFLDQFKDFLIKVPKITTYLSLGYGPNINSEYVNMASGCKNSYLVFNTGPVEEVMYTRGVRDSRECSDLYFGVNDERCYESVNIHQSAGVLWGKNVSNSVDSVFVTNCRNVMNCFGCVNLNNKSYHFLNQPLSQEEYKKKVEDIMGSHEKIEAFKKEFKEFSLKFPMRENHNIKTVDSSGDYLFECKNVKDSFEVTKSENCRYIFSSKEIKDSIGTTGYGVGNESVLEVVATGHCSNVIGSYGLEHCVDVMYGFYATKCHDCIACDALQNGKYAIFNKEYSKEEYERLKKKIMNELVEQDLCGLIMPASLAPFAYNETIAQDNFPLTKEEVLALGMRWEDDIQKTEGRESIQPEDIADNIKNVPDSMTQETLRCVECKRNYKIIEQELLFYRKMNVPIPRRCFYCRHQDRVVRRGPYRFWNRNCVKCNKEIRTNYSPERPEIVYCEQCYQQEVY